ncbi:MAG: TM2 domain-containing protein [Clostridia bacterium]|nr:TM2 domain-containing protein [Clostridia bacterium]
MARKLNEDEVIDEKKLKKNELICGVVGLAIAVITAIFLFVNAISFTVEIADGETVNFSTSVFRLLNSDFNVTYGNSGVSYWSLFHPDFDVSAIKDYQWVIVACSWVSLIGCIASLILYPLFLIGKRTPFFCEWASRCAAIGCGIPLIAFMIGEISFSGVKLYAEGVSYNCAVPVIYAVIMAGALICISYLCSYSKARREVLKQAKLEKAAKNTVASEPETEYHPQPSKVTNTVEDIYNSPVYEDGEEYDEVEEPQPPVKTTDYSQLKQAVIEKYKNELTPTSFHYFKEALNEARPQVYKELLDMPLKKKTTTILLSVFLGNIGVDRFYVGDNKLGALKIMGTVVAMLCNFVPVLGIIAAIANAVWKIADIFISHKKAKDRNYENAMAIIKS